ncbi:cold shock domain-containing protein [Sphingomonas sp. MMSM20]|nr:cold shock domain-containing protein [Sphingomonas lycopersici]
MIVATDIDLRRLVRNQLGETRPVDQVLAPDLLTKVRDRAARDGLIEDVDVYDYLDFPDSVQTLRRHKVELDQDLARFIQKNGADLDRLTPIRNRVMHGRPLQFTDFSVVDDFVQKIRGSRARWFPQVIEFEDRIRENPNFVYSLDLSRLSSVADRIPHNLPLPDYDETGFLGREQETTDLLAACKSNWPVVTVVGEGGFGKTALALRVAYELLDDENSGFEAIVWATAKRTVLTLDDIRTIDDAIQDSLGLIKCAASALGASTDENVVMDEVAEYLNSFKILLILDNLETVLDPLLTRFIRRSTGKSKILATSRVGIGEMSYPFKLGGLSVNEAVQLLRTTAKVRRIADIYKAKTEVLRSYVQGMKLNPGFIKWFVSCVQCGRQPDVAITNPKTFLDFCLSNVYEHVSSAGKEICKAMIAVPGRHPLAMISYLSGLHGDDLQQALAALQSANLVGMHNALTGSGTETVYELNELPRLYILKNHAPSASETTLFRQRKKDVAKEFQRLQADRGNNRYNPRSIACRNQADAITAKLLGEALARSAANDYEEAVRLVGQAQELDRTFSEVYRVEAWIEAYGDRPAAAAEAYDNALAIEPNSAPLRYWYGGFLLRVSEDAHAAAEQLLIAEALDPDSPAILLELARVEMYLGQYEEADDRLERLLLNVTASTRHRRMAYDTWLQVKIRSATNALEAGRYSDSLDEVRAGYDRFVTIPEDLYDERIFGTIRRGLGILALLSEKLSVSGLRPEVERCYQDIEGLRFDPLLAIRQCSQPRTPVQICDETDVGKSAIGVIHTVNVAKRFGFINFGDNKRIFFHFSEFENAILHAKPGISVEFLIERRDERICAVRVRPSSDSDAAAQTRLGTVKAVLTDKSFGFLTDANGGDLFFHRSNLCDGFTLESLAPGDPVSFVIGRNHKGPIATEVKPALHSAA